MPRITRDQICGMSLRDLLNLLQAVVGDGTYPRESIEILSSKIEKRLLAGDELVDDNNARVFDELLKSDLMSGGYE